LRRDGLRVVVPAVPAGVGDLVEELRAGVDVRGVAVVEDLGEAEGVVERVAEGVLDERLVARTVASGAARPL
jgi:hypothetical protein